MEEAYYVRCYGANLNNGFAEGPNKFTILTDDTYDVTQLRIGFEGPAQPDVKLVTKKNRNVDVTYVTAVGGDYKIHILYKGCHIFSSPFNLKIVGDVEANVKKVVCTGATKLAKRNEDNVIVIDGRIVGIAGGISARVVGPSMPLLRFYLG